MPYLPNNETNASSNNNAISHMTQDLCHTSTAAKCARQKSVFLYTVLSEYCLRIASVILKTSSAVPFPRQRARHCHAAWYGILLIRNLNRFLNAPNTSWQVLHNSLVKCRGHFCQAPTSWNHLLLCSSCAGWIELPWCYPPLSLYLGFRTDAHKHWSTPTGDT